MNIESQFASFFENREQESGVVTLLEKAKKRRRGKKGKRKKSGVVAILPDGFKPGNCAMLVRSDRGCVQRWA